MSVPVLSITINEGDQSLIAKTPYQFTTTIQPEDASNKNVTWNSSNPEFATVDNNGSVTGYHDGITILTATSLDNPTINSSVQVTIKTIPVESITMNINETTINVNGTVLLSATILPQEATDQTITWYCTNPAAASISVQMNPRECLVTGLSSGLAIINATTPNNKITNSYVYVGIIPVASVTLSQHTVNLDENQTKQLVATVQPNDATNPTVTWFTSNPAIATVDQNGVVTAKTVGSVAVTARAVPQTDTAYIFVNPVNSQDSYTATDSTFVPVGSIAINTQSLTISIGQTQNLSVTIEPNSASDQTTNWTSSDLTIASVDQAGTVTALSTGTAIINVSCGNTNSQAFITVE